MHINHLAHNLANLNYSFEKNCQMFQLACIYTEYFMKIFFFYIRLTELHTMDWGF